MDWLVASLVLSIVLTIVLNVVLRAFPRAGEAIGRKLDPLENADDRPSASVDERHDRRAWIVFPWKGMLIASLVLTVLLNLLLRIA